MIVASHRCSLPIVASEPGNDLTSGFTVRRQRCLHEAPAPDDRCLPLLKGGNDRRRVWTP